MRWSGRHLLYGSLVGQVAIVDAEGRRRELAGLANALPQLAAELTTAAWLSDYPRP
jgi:hypothetical protein